MLALCAAALAAAAIGPATAAAATWTDDDFAGGTADTGAWVLEPGLLQLKPTGLAADFDSLPPSDWSTHTWADGGAAATAGGALTVDGGFAGTQAPFGPGAVLEFRGALGGDSRQHVGFGVTLDGLEPWALFSTGDDGTLRARTTDGATPESTTDISIPDPSATHVFRIEWNAGSVVYRVDGAVVATDTIAITGNMHVVASDYTIGGNTVRADWLKVLPYGASGGFESRVFDSGKAATTWARVDGVPSGAGVSVQTRSGSTPAADATWSPWQPVAADGVIASPRNRYIQYRVALSTSDSQTTPSVDQIAISYALDNDAPSTSIGTIDVSGDTATVSFSSPATDVAGYECTLDAGDFAACTSPKQLTALSDGTHTVSVRAIDQAGNVGDSDSKSFTIASPSVGGGADGGGGGGAGGGGGGGTPPAAGDTTAPTMTVVARSVKVSRSGKVGLKLACPAGESRCVVRIKLRLGHATVASGSRTIAGGKTATVTLKLSKAARKRLAKSRTLKLKALVTAADAAGNRSAATISVTVRAR